MNILDTLNEVQQQIVKAKGNVRIIAGAGTGKTRVLTSKIAYMIKELNISSLNILAITFTNKAAREMKERVTNLIGNEVVYTQISTFHSTCLYILRIDAKHLGYKELSIVDADDQRTIFKRLYKEHGREYREYYRDDIKLLSLYKQEGSLADNNYITNAKQLNNIFEQYHHELKRQSALDFDDLLFVTVELFNKFPDILAKWQRKFQYIFVDEYQDINDIQYQFIKLLSGNRENICVVGDPDQTIYTFRGAKIDYIMRFDNDFKNVQTFLLEKNYRSTKKILDSTNKFIKQNSYRIEKNLYTDNIEGENAIYVEQPDLRSEGVWMAQMINQVMSNGETKYSDFAILCRTRAMMNFFEQALVSYSIPYVKIGDLSFFSRQEIKDLIAYLKLIVNDYDDIAFERILNVPKRKLGNTTLEQIRLVAKAQDCSLFEVCCEHLDQVKVGPAAKNGIIKFIKLIKEFRERGMYEELIPDIVSETNYLSMYKPDETPKRLDHIQQLKDLYIQNCHEDALDITEFLQRIALMSDDRQRENEEFVYLMTVHSAKGLEFDHVFVPGLYEGNFPHFNARGDKKAEEEETRIGYVAFTRAKKQLYLSRSMEDMRGGRTMESPFIEFFDVLTKTQRADVILNRKMYTFAKSKAQNTGAAVGNDYRAGQMVNHTHFGDGVVIGVDGIVVEIAFMDPSVGIKKISFDHKALTKI